MKKRFIIPFLLLLCLLLISSFPAQAAVTKPGAVNLTSITSSAYNKVTIKWKKTSNATNYIIYYKKAGAAKWTKLASVASSKTSYTHTASQTKKIVVGQSYYYTVRAYNSKSKKYGSYNTKGLNIKTLPNAPVLQKVTCNPYTQKATITWKKAKGCDYYILYKKTDTYNFWIPVKKLKSTTLKYVDTYEYPDTKITYTILGYYSPTKVYGKTAQKELTLNVPLKWDDVFTFQENYQKLLDTVFYAESDLEWAENGLIYAQEEYNYLNTEKKSWEATLKLTSDQISEINHSLEALKTDIAAEKTRVQGTLDQIARGSLGFFESVGATDAINFLTKAKYASFTHIGDPKDATSLDNMKATFPHLRRCNKLRALEGLPALKVHDNLMAMAQSNTNWSYINNGSGHCGQFMVAENLSESNANYDPYEGWYWGEKESKGGHYQNIVNPSLGTTGYAINQYGGNPWFPDGNGQVFFYSEEDEFLSHAWGYNIEGCLTVDEYEKRFDQYYLPLMDKTRTYRNYISKFEEQTKKLVALTETYTEDQTDYKEFLSEFEQAEKELESAKREYDNCKNILDNYQKELDEMEKKINS